MVAISRIFGFEWLCSGALRLVAHMVSVWARSAFVRGALRMGLVEPVRAERLPFGLFLGGVPFAAVLVRAAWRAVGSLALPGQEMTAATIGFFRPRIILSDKSLAHWIHGPWQQLLSMSGHTRAIGIHSGCGWRS